MKPKVSKQKQITGLLYGLVAGLTFAVLAWGIDGIQLARAHGAFSWVKFVPGLLVCVICSGLVGWLVAKLQSNLLGIVFWLALMLVYSQLILWLPIRVAPFLIKIFNGALGNYLQYPYYSELNQNLWFGFAVFAIIAIINGMIENILIDQALFSSGKAAVVIPLLVCALSFGLAGSIGDSLLNKNLREPIRIVDELIQFAQDNYDKEVPSAVAKSMHLNALNPVMQYVTLDRKLVLSNYDQYLGQVEVLVDFEGKWVKCVTIYNQVTNCRPAFEIPSIRLTSIKKFVEATIPETSPQYQ